MEKRPFVHLHTHSHYSLLDGLSQIPDLVARAKELGMEALALTDHGAMYGTIEFYKTCKANDIKPIVGVELYMAERTRFDKEHGIDNKRYHLTVLAKNETGYKNLMKIVSKASTEGYYYKPRADKDLLREYSEGIICLTGCPGSEFINHMKNQEYKKARNLLTWYIETFGKENVFIEVMQHSEVAWYDQTMIDEIIKISEEFDQPIVGTWDSHYLHPDDREAHDTLLAINTNNTNFKLDGDYSFIDSDQAREIFKDIPGAYKNTARVADLVDLEITLNDWKFPEYDIPADTTYEQVLRDMAYDNIEKRGLERSQEVTDRIEYELGIINEKGYPSYFLIVADLLRFAAENHIYTNTRGSAAGSLVSYLVGITNVDPLRFRLPFERFLNPERPSLPDIDMDFADNRRDEVIEYAKEKYGEEKVAQIGTFGTLLARGAVRDVARALGFPYDVGDRISKMIPMGSQGFPMTIDRALDMEPDLKKAYENEQDTKKIIDLARRIEGCSRHVSVHAAGVVIAPTRVDDFTPVQLDPKGGKLITQYDMHSVEEAGLPKFDFLGIRNLAILGDAIHRVKKIRGIEIDIEDVSLDDKKTFDLLSRGETMGVFQMASAGMTRYVKELKPNKIEDLNAMVALYRPGPMEFIPDYIKRKENPRLVKYIDPRLKSILEPTYGILIYQDDILLIAVNLAGYSWGEADKFRKAVGKKIPEEMEKQHTKFVDGCIEHGMEPNVAKQLWDMIETFAAYGFNKAHAASYGQLAYRTAYMKANYPIEYMTAIMTAESGRIEKVAEVINECDRMGFVVLPPDINESFSDFTVVVEDGIVTNKIRFGLRNIKNFGEGIGKAIITERKERGPFKSIEDFLERVHDRNLNKKSLEALIMCGAMDSLGERGQLLHNIEALLTFNKELQSGNENQGSLFGDLDSAPTATLTMETVEPADKNDMLAWEKELLGLYISGHPLEQHKEKLEKVGMNIKRVREDIRGGITVVIAGVIEETKEILTKKQDRMAFVRISDLTGSIEGVVFPKVFEKHREILNSDTVIAIKARISDRNGERSLVVEEIKAL